MNEQQIVFDPSAWRVIDFAFSGFIFLGGVIVSLLVYRAREVMGDVKELHEKKADKADVKNDHDALTRRFDALDNTVKGVGEKIDANQRETTRMLMDLVRNGRRHDSFGDDTK